MRLISLKIYLAIWVASNNAHSAISKQNIWTTCHKVLQRSAHQQSHAQARMLTAHGSHMRDIDVVFPRQIPCDHGCLRSHLSFLQRLIFCHWCEEFNCDCDSMLSLCVCSTMLFTENKHAHLQMSIYNSSLCVCGLAIISFLLWLVARRTCSENKTRGHRQDYSIGMLISFATAFPTR